MSALITGDELINQIGRINELLRMPGVPVTHEASAIASREDVGKVVYMNSASPLNYTVLQDSAMEDPILDGTPILLINEGDGVVTLVEGDGVELVPPPGMTLVSAGKGAWITLLKRSATKWHVRGDLVPS